MENEEDGIDEFPEDEEDFDMEEDEEDFGDDAAEELFRENPLKAIFIRQGEILEALNGS